jgi:DNA (cytosine-5)-methyltransferase 1
MKILNLYAGLGGNRKYWRDCQVTAIEADDRIANVYQKLYPDDEVLVDDAHQYLLNHYNEFDFVWSSPPCQSHSRMNKASRHKPHRFPDLKLYEEILLLQQFHNGLWIVENVVPYYEPLIQPSQRVGRHLFWSNFFFLATEVPGPGNIAKLSNLKGKQIMHDWLGIHFEEIIYYGNNHCPVQILRNCVHPFLGLQIYSAAKKYFLTYS